MNEKQDVHVGLRPMSEADLLLVLGWRNHPQVRDHMFLQHEINFDEHLCWFNTASVDESRRLLIFEVDSVPLGYVNFSLGDLDEAVWGFYIAPDAPKGTGRLLGKTALDYVFGPLGIKCLWGNVLSTNVASQNFHIRLGFTLENTLTSSSTDTAKASEVKRYMLTVRAWVDVRGKG